MSEQFFSKDIDLLLSGSPKGELRAVARIRRQQAKSKWEFMSANQVGNEDLRGAEKEEEGTKMSHWTE